MIAALFVESEGIYYNRPDVDCWDKDRDARLYEGPWPIVAHPPCQLWGALAFVNFKRWGGDHNRPGNDGGCFLSALKNIWRFGGVIEHPKSSHAWKEYGLLKPEFGKWKLDSNGGWVTEVWQSAYGHLANKATWLYAVTPNPPDLKWEKIKGDYQCGCPDRRGKARNKPTLSKKLANGTPIEFAELLLSIARDSGKNLTNNRN